MLYTVAGCYSYNSACVVKFIKVVAFRCNVVSFISAGKEGRSGGTSAKSSFLASLNPSRWGRSSNAAPDRPPPPKDPISLHKPNPSLPNHKEKVRTWIKQQGMDNPNVKPQSSSLVCSKCVRKGVKKFFTSAHDSLYTATVSLFDFVTLVKVKRKMSGISSVGSVYIVSKVTLNLSTVIWRPF